MNLNEASNRVRNDADFAQVQADKANLEIDLSMLRNILRRYKNSKVEIVVSLSTEGSIGISVDSKQKMEAFGGNDLQPSEIADILDDYHGQK